MQRGVLTLTIAEHSNGKKIQRHFAHCLRAMKFVRITTLTITWCYLSTKTKLCVAAMKCPASQVYQLQMSLRCSCYHGGSMVHFSANTLNFVLNYFKKTMVMNSWRRGRRLHVVLLNKLEAIWMLMKLVAKTNVMGMKIALTCFIDRKIKNASCIALVIHRSIINQKKENFLRRN